MLAIRNLLKANTQIVKNVTQQRNMSATCTPPRNKVPKAEFLFLATAMVLSWCAIPAWVVVHIKDYRNKE